MYAYASADSRGLPHSSHSSTVSGSDGSRIVFNGSTKGTSATMPVNALGAMFATAPMSRPPAEPPRAISRAAEVQPDATRCSEHATKSVNVFFFASSLPSSYHRRPISPPPRTCATANTNPRSTRDSRGIENQGSMLASYEPYPYRTVGADPSRGVSRLHANEMGTRVP